MNATLHIPQGATFTAEEFKKCAEDPVYMANEYGWTFDPRPEAYPHHLRFKLYPFQEDLLLDVIKRIRFGKSLMLEKSRDMGASWVVLFAILHCWLFMPGFQALIGSRTQDLVDNGTMDCLFEKIEYMLDRLPFEPKGYSKDKCKTFLKMVNPDNKNVIKGEAASPNFGRQGRYRVVLLDEMAFWENPNLSWSSCGESTRCRIAITTPPRKVNFAKALRFSGLVDVTTLLWKLHPLKDQEWYERAKAEKMPEELAAEVDINWEGSITGRVYPEVAHVRVGSFPYRPDWPLYVAHDPGRSPDPWSIGWFQVNPDTGRYRLVDAWEKGGQDPEWWLPFFGKLLDSQYAYLDDELSLMETTKEWKAAMHVGDQAGRMTNPTNGESVYSRLRDKGIYVTSNTKANDLETRKRYARRVLQNIDVNDTPGTRYAMECWRSARYPDLAETNNRVTPNSVPIHDWTSHARTMLEFFAVNVDLDREPEPDLPGPGTFMEALAAVRSNNMDNDY